MSSETTELEGVAVVGLAGRFPGARTVAEFWRNLCGGVESISFFGDDELVDAGVDAAMVRAPNYVKARGVLGDAEMFDASFFGLSPREAALMDPQHRLFLEVCWEALEGAGYSPDRPPGRVGVFGGMSMNTYLLTNIYAHLSHVASVESLQASIGNDKDALTTEVAYRLGLKGPAVTIQSSSSTSLTAIHYAVQGLLGHECDMALAGGVSIHFPEKAGYLYYEGGPSSPDGHCRTFDAKAKGFVAGHGAGAVALKRLADALADGDVVYAVVKGSAVNNDGAAKVSYMAPSVEGQAEVIQLAQAVAGVEPASVGYVEAHGTGTPIGDPIEVAALTQAFRAGTDAKGFCALGSAKTNIGHLDAAAGVAGFIKAALVLHHKLIPPSLHFESPNPALDLENSPFYVNARLAPWPEGETPRRAGVTSLGMGGTNAHVVLEEAPAAAEGDPARLPYQLLLLSARSDSSLEAATERLAACLREQPGLDAADVAYTLQVGRKRRIVRRALVCRGVDDAAGALAARDAGRLIGGAAGSEGRPVMFLFSGQGAQYPDMGRQLYELEPSFRADIDACAASLERHLGFDLRSVLYPPEGERDGAAERLRQTSVAQPALFVTEYALARLWMRWGVKPRALLGHSVGEFVAATLAGVFALDDVLLLVAERGRLMQALPSGAMLAVALGEAELSAELGDSLSLAAVNAPDACVVSGPLRAIEALEARLGERGVASSRLHTSHAFHSAMMNPIVGAFAERVRRVKRNAPTLPYLSNVSGGWVTPEQATDPEYWAAHLRGTVRFADGVAELLKEEDAVLLEIGPGQTLAMLARRHPAKTERHLIASSVRHPRESKHDVEFLLGALGRLWVAGVEPDWDAFYDGERRRRVALPTSPFERQRHWVDPPETGASRQAPAASADRKLAIDRWFYLPSWKRTPLPPAGAWAREAACWWLLVSEAEQGLGALLARRLSEAGQRVVCVTPGEGLLRHGPGRWSVDPRDEGGLGALLRELSAEGLAPDRIVHAWLAGEGGPGVGGAEAFEEAQNLGFFSLLALGRALGTRAEPKPLSLLVVTRGAQAFGDEEVCAERATVLGPGRVLAQELPEVRCRLVDLGPPSGGERQRARLVESLLDECVADGEPVVAYRAGQRWARTFEPAASTAGAGGPLLRERGVYLLLGGFGTVGYAHAEALARGARARLVLAGRSALPEDRATWDAYLVAHDAADPIARRIRQVLALEALGAEVLVARVDVADEASVRAAVGQAVERFGGLHGVVFAAGTVDASLFRPIGETDRSTARGLLRERARGLCALEAALGGRPLDFCLLSSSLASALGGVGRAAYAAATSFMDAFALARSRASATPWLSAGWDAWAFEDGAPLANPLGELAITRGEGVEAFGRLLGMLGEGHVIVSTADLGARAALPVRAEPARAEGRAEHMAADAQAAGRAPRPVLQNAYVAPRDELEATLAGVWEAMLGIERVGVHDNFFELGGNSLVGVKLVARVREQFGTALPAVSLYEGPTVEGLARLLRAEAGEGAAGGEGPEGGEEEGPSRGERRRARRQRRGDAEPGREE
jgi:acyl transferase domain-containing protein